MEPHERMRKITSPTVDVDPRIPLKRYYRSGKEMVRMANVYQGEGNFERALILYIKFTILFLEKIPTHPEYKQFDAASKRENKEKIKEVFPIAERLKVKLMEKFQQDYEQHLELMKQQEIERERDAAAAAQRQKEAENVVNIHPNAPIPSTTNSHFSPTPSAPELLDHVIYPNDFPVGANKSNLPSSGLLLPDSKAVIPKPVFDRSLKPAANSESMDYLRQVLVPKDTMSKFLALAKKNTTNKIETCGILVGRLSYNLLTITHVIVPKQHGTPDSCTTTNEEEIFDIQDQFNLITIGWIHTHPTQTAFLSSVDLHTHCSYQIMMPEAIAIVCAPKYQTTGFFCLTPGYGLEYIYISNCRENGFHPHPNDPPLFMDALHIQIDNTLHLDVIDLR